MSTTIDGPRRSFKAVADYRTKQFYIVKLSADNEVTLASAASDLLVGVICNKPNINETASVFGRWGGGTGKVKLGVGGASRGNYLTADASGTAVATTSAGQEVIGRALQAGDAGDVIEFAPLGGVYAVT